MEAEAEAEVEEPAPSAEEIMAGTFNANKFTTRVAVRTMWAVCYHAAELASMAEDAAALLGPECSATIILRGTPERSVDSPRTTAAAGACDGSGNSLAHATAAELSKLSEEAALLLGGDCKLLHTRTDATCITHVSCLISV